MLTTFPQLLLKHAAERPTAPALREKEYGIWQTHSWADLVRLVEQVAAGLHLAGLQRHEHMVVIGANRPRLYATMLAAQSLGAIPVPLYQDAVGAECVFPINNAEVRFVVVEDQEQVDKMLEIREQCPQLAQIYFDDPRGLRNYDEPGLQSLDALVVAKPESYAWATGAAPGVASFFRRAGSALALIPADASRPISAVATELFAAPARAARRLQHRQQLHAVRQEDPPAGAARAASGAGASANPGSAAPAAPS